MPARKSRGAAASAGVARRHVGVIDIGSNSIRLVVFDSLSRALNPLFNEKILCGIGRGLQRTGRLHEDGARQAVANLRRFAALARAMGVGRLRVMATAAVRDAENGQEFVAEVRRKAGLAVQTLGGDEEARLSALGVVSGIPGADGLMGDLGGGSLELVALDRGALGRHVTLPFGPLRLRELNDRSRAALRDHIDGELERHAWLDRVEGREFYAVGGAWRALARIHMEHVNYPLRVIHHYTLSRGRAEDFADVLARLSRDSLERITRISRRRLEALPYAALVLERVLRRARPARLVFSALGLREGCMYDALPATVRRRDPLLGACQELAEQNARFPVSGEALRDWVAPVLGRGDREGERLRLAACMLGDIAWSEHPDYRAEIGFLRVLRMPLTGIDHPGRAFMALAVFTRYSGVADSEVTRSAWQLLDEARLSDAFRLGLALRLAFTLSGGTTQVLRRARLRLSGGSLQLILPRASLTLAAEAVERRLAALADALDKKHVVKAA